MASKLLTSFFLVFLIIASPSYASSSPISSALELLSNSNYFSLGLTLQLANNDLSLDDWQELTIFAPSDKAFYGFGQPSLLDIKYQLSPTRIHGETLRNLPIGAKIPTMRSDSSLTVTNSSRSGLKLSINNVVVRDFPVYDDGYVVIYGADEFFTDPDSFPSSSISSPDSIPIPSSATRTAPDSSQNPRNRSKRVNSFNIFESVSNLFTSRGFVIMATFLALQLTENVTRIILFALLEDAIQNPTTKFSDYVTIFRGHVIKRLLLWKDLQKLAWEGSILQTVLKGYEIKISESGDILLLNGVPLIYQNLYQMIEPEANQVNNGEEDDGHEEYSSGLGDFV